MNLTGKLLFLICCLLSAEKLMAQICNGSLGDPVININFGSGMNPGPPLPSKNTNYDVTFSGCPNDGSYTIVNSLDYDCHGSSWHRLKEDRTPGDMNGYMMLVNADYTPGIFYQETVSGLCANTTYEFAAWIVNVLRPGACNSNGISPNITFTISSRDGRLLARPYNTGDIRATSELTWKQYGMFFTTLDEGDVVITMINNAPGGCGNDLALDDITFRPCGPSVNSSIVGLNTLRADMCAGDSRSFTFETQVSSGYNDPAYQWQQRIGNSSWTNIPGATSPTYRVNFEQASAGTYAYRMATAEAPNINSATCRIFSDVITVNVNDLPRAIAGSNSPACLNSELRLTASGGDIYLWTGPDGFQSNLRNPVIPAVTARNAGEYQVIVTSAAGCVSVASTVVETKENPVAQVNQQELTICYGDAVMLEASGGEAYEWLPAAGLSDPRVANPIAKPLETTIYTVKVTNGNVCSDWVTVKVNVVQVPMAVAGPDVEIFEGQQIVLGSDSTTQTQVRYLWTPPDFLDDPTSSNPVATPSHDVTYTLTVIPENGCPVVEDAIFIRVYQEIKIPNTFSPNGDGINDNWKVEALDTYPEADVKVYNRNGQLVFESKGYSTPWDGMLNGKSLPTGSYYYIIDLKNGTEKLSSWLYLGK
jgi:gliding motility-associated-like protein